MMKGRMVKGRQKRAYVMAQEAVAKKISLNKYAAAEHVRVE